MLNIIIGINYNNILTWANFAKVSQAILPTQSATAVTETLRPENLATQAKEYE